MIYFKMFEKIIVVSQIWRLHWPVDIIIPGGTAVGTGLNSRIGFAEKIAAKIAEETGQFILYQMYGGHLSH